MKMPPQVSRLLLAFTVLIVGFIAFRSAMVPPTFGQEGFYRAAFTKELAKHPISYAGRDACMMCHEDIAKSTPHVTAGVGCESCHGPSNQHAQDFEAAKPAVPDSRQFCGTCHAKIPARRFAFPQVDLREHNPKEKCVSCHVIHEGTAR